jgi:hypothetical protein
MKYKIDDIEVTIFRNRAEFTIADKFFVEKIEHDERKENIPHYLLFSARATIMKERGIIHPIKKEDFTEIQERFEPVKINE